MAEEHEKQIRKYRNRLQKKIKSGKCDIDELSRLNPETQIRVLQSKDGCGRNAMLSAVHSNNLQMVMQLADALQFLDDAIKWPEFDYKLELQKNATISTIFGVGVYDSLRNNVLQLAFQTGNRDMVDFIYEIMCSFDSDRLTTYLITHENHDDATALFYSIQKGFHDMVSTLIDKISFDNDNVNIISRVNASSGYSALMLSAKHDKRDLTRLLFDNIRQNTCGEVDIQRLFTENAVTTEGRAPKTDTLLSLATKHQDDYLIERFVDSIPAEMLLTTLKTPHHPRIKCALSLLIEDNCCSAITYLMAITTFQTIFKNYFKIYENHTWLCGHVMVTSMIETLSAYCEQYYVIPKNSPRMEMCAILFYTAKHSNPKRERAAAYRQYKQLKDALKTAGFNVITILKGNILWRRGELEMKLRKELRDLKDRCSLLVTCGMCHGGEGFICDSYMGYLTLNDMIQLINDNMNDYIPKVTVIPSCRLLIIEEDIYNLSLQYKHNAVMFACSRGQTSGYSKKTLAGYIRAIATLLNNGEKNFFNLHQRATAWLHHAEENRNVRFLRTKNPEWKTSPNIKSIVIPATDAY